MANDLPLRGFVQTDLATHEAWSQLTMEKPAAAALLHKLIVLADRDNLVVASYAALAEQLGVSAMTIRRAIKVLRDGDWIDAAQVGGAGTVNAYVLNSTVAWRKRRDGLQYAAMRGTVLLSGSEQGDRRLSEQASPLRHQVPGLLPDEAQLPSGKGLPPVSQPVLDGFLPDIPARRIPRD